MEREDSNRKEKGKKGRPSVSYEDLMKVPYHTFTYISLARTFNFSFGSVAQLCLTLCDPMDYSPPSSTILGILQAGILEWVAMPSSRGSSQPRDGTQVSCVSCIGRWFLYC